MRYIAFRTWSIRRAPDALTAQDRNEPGSPARTCCGCRKRGGGPRPGDAARRQAVALLEPPECGAGAGTETAVRKPGGKPVAMSHERPQHFENFTRGLQSRDPTIHAAGCSSAAGVAEPAQTVPRKPGVHASAGGMSREFLHEKFGPHHRPAPDTPAVEEFRGPFNAQRFPQPCDALDQSASARRNGIALHSPGSMIGAVPAKVTPDPKEATETNDSAKSRARPSVRHFSRESTAWERTLCLTHWNRPDHLECHFALSRKRSQERHQTPGISESARIPSPTP